MTRLVRVQARVEASQSGKGEGLMVLADNSAEGKERVRQGIRRYDGVFLFC